MKVSDLLDIESGALAQETGAGRFQVAVWAGPTALFADEPVALGGEGSGPAPFDLLCAALAACTTMTMRLYLAQKDWPVRNIRTVASHRRDKDGGNHFTCLVAWDGILDPARRDRLLGVAARCPVHRTLAGGSAVTVSETDLAGQPPYTFS